MILYDRMAPEMLRGENYDASVDIFSFGIVACEVIGRVKADPDEMPRTSKFGLDIEKFANLPDVKDCPRDFLQLAVDCCVMNPKDRPTFETICSRLDEIRIRHNYPAWHTIQYDWPPELRRGNSSSVPNLSMVGK